MIRYGVWITPPPLDRHVARVFHMRGEGGFSDWIFPDVGGADIAIHLAEPGRVRGPKGWIAAARLVVGGLSRAVLTEHAPATHVIGIQLAPGCACLLGVPAAALRDVALPLGDLAPALDAALARWADHYVAGKASISELAALLSARVGRRCDAAMCRAAATLSLGDFDSVAGVAEDHALSRRHFARRFQARVGVSPRRFQQIARFARAWRLALEAPSNGWAAIAAEAGYCDQPHLVRDFTTFVGLPPRRVFTPEWYAAVDAAASTQLRCAMSPRSKTPSEADVDSSA